MRITKKVLSMVLALVLVLGLLPATASAAGYVYLSVSDDGQFISNTMAHRAVSLDELASVDLDAYGLSDYLYDADGDGTNEITALHLYIYTHVALLGHDWSEVTVTGGAGSIYFAGGLFGFSDENLRYNYNGAYPADENGWGYTADRIVLSAGDYFDVAHYSDWNFYADSAYGFHYFVDGNDSITHAYTAEAGTPLSAKVVLVGGGMGMGDTITAEAGYTVYYGQSIGNAADSVTTDDSGIASITFPSAGTWYVWCDGGEGVDMAAGAIVSSPASAVVTVTGDSAGGDSGDSGSGDSGSEPEEADTDTALKVTADEGVTVSATASFCEDCCTMVSNMSQAASIETTIDWSCEEHNTSPENFFYNISVNAFNADGYVVTGFTINGTEYTVDPYDEEYSTTYIDDLSYIAENTNCTSLAILSNETTAPADQVIHVHTEAVVEEEPPRVAQDVSAVLNATMAKLAATVTAPAFGTNAGEWTVLSLARGGYYAKDNAYFTDYYARIVETVNTTAASVNLNGALHKNKSTDNSRLIVALSSIGKNATSVGDWDLVEAYSANGFTWIKKQGINGAIWALIALDSNNYATTDTTIRQQCVDYILSLQKDDGGWTLSGSVSDPDITGMTLQALYPYRSQTAVATACEEAFTCLSEMQLDNGGFPYGTSETSESAAQVIVACTTWGINPDTDTRFVKNNKSAVDALLAYYVESETMFEHQAGAGTNDMATDQACYALVAYDRLMDGKTALYDYSDVTFDPVTPDTGDDDGSGDNTGDDDGSEDNTGSGSGNTGDGSTDTGDDTVTEEMSATLGVPAEIQGTAGTAFNAVISINTWNNDADYKLIDFIMTIPEGLSVTGVTAGSRLSGGEVSWNLEAETGKLRVAYFDANENNTLEISGTEFPAEVFTIGLKLDKAMTSGTKLDFAITGMSVKLTSDSEDEASMVIVNTTNSDGTSVGGSSGVVTGVSFSAVCLYEGDDVDLIPSTKKAVAVAVTGITKGSKLAYDDGTNEIAFLYSAEITAKTGVSTYVALVDASIEMENFVNEDNFTISSATAETITFADTNGDGVINAQDALAAVDAWLRKGDEPTGDAILILNVNGDSRINTFDALGIVEKFVNGSDYGVVTKAATITSNS